MGGSGPQRRVLALGGRRVRGLCEGSGGPPGRTPCSIGYLFSCSDGRGSCLGHGGHRSRRVGEDELIFTPVRGTTLTRVSGHPYLG